MSTQSVGSVSDGSVIPGGSGLVPGADLLRALQAVRDGDFSVRLPGDKLGLEGKLADTFNEIVTANARMAAELKRVGESVGKKGKTRQRVKFGTVHGAWGEMEGSVNTLMDDLLWPTTEVTRAISAVAQGNLMQTVPMEVDGRPLEGEFLKSATIVNTMIQQLGVFTSEVTRVAREVGTDGKLGGQAEVNEVSGVWKDLTEMPDLDGFELAAMIRNHPRFQKTAIILVSGVLVEDADRLRGYGSGAVDYVSVPIVPEILRAKVSVFADLYRKTEELKQLNRELEERVAERTAEIQSALQQAQEARLDAETANRLKDEFLATLSHELRTPLNAITGWAYLLQAGGLDKATEKKAVETIRRSAQLQTQLISDILDVSRIIAGKLRLNLEAVNLTSVVQAALDSLRPAADAKGVRLETRLAAETNISGDSGRLQQVIWNLVSNAIKFAPTGGRVLVTLSSTDTEIETTIEDDGNGIKPEFLPYIFDRFRQADSSSTRSHHGLGLGLAIVKHLVQMHGGTVQAMNRSEAKGACFKVILPIRVAVAGPHSVPAVDPSPAADAVWLEAAPSLSGVRVLVVDDEADGREVAAAVLERCGAETRIAGSVSEAMAMIEREPPDVLVADIEMPGEDGYALLRRLRTLPMDRGLQIPAAALTAYASSQDRLKVLSAGFQMHVAKPVQPVDLARAVASLAEARVVSQDAKSK